MLITKFWQNLWQIDSKILPHSINEDQTGYIKGRFIGCNIRQMEDVIIYSELNHAPGIILTEDFEKAFDSISWNFIDKTLEAFNFGSVFTGCVKTLYKIYIFSNNKQWGHLRLV